MYTAMKTRAKTEHHHGKGDSNQGQTTKQTSKDVKTAAGGGSVLLSPASGVSDKRSPMTGSRELQNLLGHALHDEDLVRVMADTARKVCQRLSPTARSSNLRSSPKKTELFQVVHGGEKKAKDTSDDTRHISDDTRHTSDDTRHTSDDKRDASDDAGPKKKLKFTSVQSAKDTDKIPKTGKKAAVLRMRREEVYISQASVLINKDVPKTTRGVDSTKSSAPAEGKAVTKRASKDSVLPHELPQHTRPDSSVSRSVATSGGEKSQKSTGSEPREEPQLGSLVWAKLSRQSWWPGLVIRGTYCALKPAQTRHRWIFWFGDHKVSEIPTERIVPFCAKFQDHMNGSLSKLFRKSVMEALEECVNRVRVNTGSDGDLDEDTRLDWAKSGFLVNGLSSENLTKPNPDRPIPEFAMVCMRKIKAQNETDSDDDDLSDDDTREEAPFRIEKLHTRVGKLDSVRQGDISIQEVCIACGEDRAVVIQHPLFDGGLCQFCKESLMETMFIFSDDGTNMFCVVCGNGGELFVCWNNACNRAYCTGCIAELTGGLDSVEVIKHTNPWTCFMCEDSTDPACLLVRKADWQCNLVAMFQPTTIHKVPQASDFDGSPIRVLSLFDGIASGKIALDELRFDISMYYASEIDDDALLVTSVQHGSTIMALGDITKLGVAEISALGPIDLVIGGSPCNDLSMVNPARKGLEGGTGLLFFEFFRILNLLQKLHPNCHLFWLFENVVFMSREDKNTISRFLECEPAVWNAKYFSAQNRARYFWGNIPGMYCPPELSPCPPPYVGLDSTLMGDRKAAVNKVRTVTTRSNSLMQGKKDDYFPVHTGTTGDTLWIPELERLFGFPEHYTDVGNIPPTRRQKLIGKAWSVPLIKHILAPLKAFYACIPDGPRVARVSEVTHL